MLGIPTLEFRFRGKSRLLLDIYYCFIEQGSPALHPTQIAKHTGISFAEAARRLEATPELFVKLPTRAGDVTRYRITSSTSARTAQEVEALVQQNVQRESLLFYSLAAMVFLTLIIVVMTIAPNV
ncbi:MAG: hypothetical protein GWP70_03290 [Proteobacteria bacterium]|nr:hypothetical protein [Pseudomonadota bacterium]